MQSGTIAKLKAGKGDQVAVMDVAKFLGERMYIFMVWS